MKIRNEKSIATIYDAVSILKGLDIINGSLRQNYYAESALFVPDRFINPLILRPKIDISDPSGSIPNGDKVDESSRLEWFENGVKINSNDDFKIEGANLTIFKNSEEPFEISYRAEWFDSRKKQVITIEDSVIVSCISLAQSDANVTMSLSKPQNWVHNPLKGERVYTINAYVSKGKVYESAVEWYYVNKEGKDVLIDDTCDFYVDGQFTNALNVDSSYMENVVIKAKNISNDKLKEIYWFFDKHGNPVTHKTPEKTEVKGANVFSLPSSPTVAKLDYRIEGLTVQNLIKNGDFSDGNKYWSVPNQNIKSVENNILTTTVKELSPYMRLETNEPELEKIIIGSKVYCRLYVKAKVDVGKLQVGGSNFTASSIKEGHLSLTSGITETTDSSNFFRYYHSSSSDYEIGDELQYSNIMIVDLTQTFGAGNEPSKEWCDEHIQGYFEGIKSVTAPLRIKSVAKNNSNESSLYINNNLELKSVGEVCDYIENGKLYKNISDEGEILEKTEVVNLSTSGNLITYPNGTIFIDNAIQLEEQYQDGITIKEDYPIQILESIKVGKEYLDTSKAVVKDNLITHPEIENGDNVTIEYIYDENPIRNTNSIAYLVLEDILDEFWLDNVYTYKITNGEWELVKVTDIEDYEEWLKTEKTSPHTLAPDGVIFGSYEAETKFIRQYPSSLYVDIIAPTRLKEGITQIKARALVGTADGVIENPSKYFYISWYKKSNKAGASDVIIGEGEELIIDIADVDRIGIELESKTIKE